MPVELDDNEQAAGMEFTLADVDSAVRRTVEYVMRAVGPLDRSTLTTAGDRLVANSHWTRTARHPRERFV